MEWIELAELYNTVTAYTLVSGSFKHTAASVTNYSKLHSSPELSISLGFIRGY
jgi:hypothetical protein